MSTRKNPKVIGECEPGDVVTLELGRTVLITGERMDGDRMTRAVSLPNLDDGDVGEVATMDAATRVSTVHRLGPPARAVAPLSHAIEGRAPKQRTAKPTRPRPR